MEAGTTAPSAGSDTAAPAPAPRRRGAGRATRAPGRRASSSTATRSGRKLHRIRYATSPRRRSRLAGCTLPVGDGELAGVDDTLADGGRQPLVGQHAVAGRQGQHRGMVTVAPTTCDHPAVDRFDAVIVGSGPNALVAAALLGRAGWRVLVLERSDGRRRCGPQRRADGPRLHPRHLLGVLRHAPRLAGLPRAGTRPPGPVGPVPRAGGRAVTGPTTWPAASSTTGPQPTSWPGASPADADAWLELCRWWDRVGRRFLEMMLGPIPGPDARGPLPRAPPAVDLAPASRQNAGRAHGGPGPPPLRHRRRARYCWPAAPRTPTSAWTSRAASPPP